MIPVRIGWVLAILALFQAQGFAQEEAPQNEIRILKGPGIVRANAHVVIRPTGAAKKGKVTFPVPGTYRAQTPLSFDLRVRPPEALIGARWRLRNDGVNWLCEVEVAPRPEGTRVEWEALVLVGNWPDQVLPKAGKPEVTDQVRPWTQATACVQSNHPKIVVKAEELRKGAEDIEAYVRRVLKLTSRISLDPSNFKSLDALHGLEKGGSCTNKANLAAALLRAQGIPARTVAHLVTWYGIHYQHWLTEYWHPGVGWVWIEPSLGQMQPKPWTLVVLNVANPEDEDKAFEADLDCMPGAPWDGVIDLSPEICWVEGENPEANWAKGVTELKGSADEWKLLWEAAIKTFPKLTQAGRSDRGFVERLEKSVKTGEASKLAEILK